MKQTRLLELSEKFVSGSLNNDELNELNHFINENEKNKELFEKNVTFIKDINKYYRTLQFKQNLNIASEKYEKQYVQKKAKIYNLIIRHTSVAAVGIIAVLITLYLSGWFTYKSKINTTYRQLSNTITTISQKQKSLWNNIFSTNRVTFIRGTAFSLSTDGLLATSYHLVKNYDSVLVINALDSSLKMHAKLIAFDEQLDVAILKITDSTFSGINNIPYNLNYNYTIELGNYVYSLGFSKNSIVFGEGSISSFTGFNEDTTTLQISIPTNPGNSGSPVFNQYGEVIGMICGKNYEKEGSSYAIRTSALKNIFDSLNKQNITFKDNNKNTIRNLPKNKQISKILPYIFKIEIY
jgi:S1-C subfamily serine protease